MVYLIFEFCTLWFRSFPAGFHYSGYAHEGAASLTVALALATLTLSLIFCGSIMSDPRVASLKKLAWVWSALNFLLVASVYNRLLIYLDFNGMTRMRVVGFLGISAVVGGFVLVLLLRLLECENQIIREGIRALLRNRQILLQSAARRDSQHWTAIQFGKVHAMHDLQGAEIAWQQARTDDSTSSALQSFHDYAMQWW